MHNRVISDSRVIAAPPETIFEILCDPTRHADFDGSNMVQNVRGESTRLTAGSTFGMDMKMGPIPYRMTNTVKEFEQDRLIAWAHMGGYRWRYQLEPVERDGATHTRVTESFDWSTAKGPRLIELMGYPKKNLANITATLERLATLVEA